MSHPPDRNGYMPGYSHDQPFSSSTSTPNPYTNPSQYNPHPNQQQPTHYAHPQQIHTQSQQYYPPQYQPTYAQHVYDYSKSWTPPQHHYPVNNYQQSPPLYQNSTAHPHPPPQPQQPYTQQQQQQQQPRQQISSASSYQPSPTPRQTSVQVQVQIPSSKPSSNKPPSAEVPSMPANSLTYINPSFMAPRQPPPVEPDKSQLLVSLAEEYFTAAHQLAPSIAVSATDHDIDTYGALLSTGLGCLATSLKKVKMSPRMEAKIRLRYAGVLFEETENYMEAETALGHGIALCDRNRYFDLKYAMQFLLAKILAMKTPKAALKALESHASDAETYQHFPWIYAFKLQRASYAFQTGTHIDLLAAVQTYRGVSTMAGTRQDYAIYMIASLLEALAHMRSTSSDAVQNVQSALAKAWTNQLNVGNICQLIGIAHFIQVACSIRQGNPMDMQQKLKDMQSMMDATLKAGSWSMTDDFIALPINSTSNSSIIVSQDTRAVLGISADGGDSLLLSFISAKDAYAINYLLCGMVNFHRNAQDQKALAFFQEGLKMLGGDTHRTTTTSGVLAQLLTQNQWRGQLMCYIRAYLAFLSAVSGDWINTKHHIEKLETTSKSLEVPLTGVLGAITLYLKGVQRQGTGDFNSALQFYESGTFDLSGKRPANPTLVENLVRDISILAVLNKLSILQVKSRRDPVLNSTVLKTMEPLCVGHANKEISTAYHLLLATIKTNPEAQMFEVKKSLKAALSGAQATANSQFTCIILSVMCSRFFTNVVGPQAEKSAQAALATAAKTGNPLWKSVAEGMLGHCLEVQGKLAEGQERLQAARRSSMKALPDS